MALGHRRTVLAGQRWRDRRTGRALANWGPGQPDNFGNNGQHIAKMFGHIPSAPGPQPGQWDDGGGGTNGIFGIDGYVIEYEGVATPRKTAITFDDTFTSPVPPESFEGLVLGYEPPNPGANAFVTQGFSFNGSTAPVTGNSGTTPQLNIIIDPALCPSVLGVPCLSNGTHFLVDGGRRSGSTGKGVGTIRSTRSMRRTPFPPGGCPTCGD